ncbi:hypothetical protein HanRHA438_Chr10g0458821 [Helianthus annuus]|nr:hypothetical protein HanRHA438_Chr10g0458821 [Helianthus annuus]
MWGFTSLVIDDISWFFKHNSISWANWCKFLSFFRYVVSVCLCAAPTFFWWGGRVNEIFLSKKKNCIDTPRRIVFRSYFLNKLQQPIGLVSSLMCD